MWTHLGYRSLGPVSGILLRDPRTCLMVTLPVHAYAQRQALWSFALLCRVMTVPSSDCPMEMVFRTHLNFSSRDRPRWTAVIRRPARHRDGPFHLTTSSFAAFSWSSWRCSPNTSAMTLPIDSTTLSGGDSSQMRVIRSVNFLKGRSLVWPFSTFHSCWFVASRWRRSTGSTACTSDSDGIESAGTSLRPASLVAASRRRRAATGSGALDWASRCRSATERMSSILCSRALLDVFLPDPLASLPAPRNDSRSARFEQKWAILATCRRCAYYKMIQYEQSDVNDKADIA